jgi:hypothetical protein
MKYNLKHIVLDALHHAVCRCSDRLDEGCDDIEEIGFIDHEIDIYLRVIKDIEEDKVFVVKKDKMSK